MPPKVRVNGYKVIAANDTTFTLETGVVVRKADCRLVSVDSVEEIMYYRHD